MLFFVAPRDFALGGVDLRIWHIIIQKSRPVFWFQISGSSILLIFQYSYVENWMKSQSTFAEINSLTKSWTPFKFKLFRKAKKFHFVLIFSILLQISWKLRLNYPVISWTVVVLTLGAAGIGSEWWDVCSVCSNLLNGRRRWIWQSFELIKLRRQINIWSAQDCLLSCTIFR